MKPYLITILVAGVIFAASSSAVLRAQETVSNYVKKTVYTQPDTSQWKRNETVWFDGLGRPVQTVQEGASPSGGDLATLTEYDALGRECRTWLPAPFTGNGGARVPAAYFASHARSVLGDDSPFSETVYDGSPLERIRRQTGPGEAWHAADKGVSYEFLTSRKTEPPFMVPCYQIAVSGNDDFFHVFLGSDDSSIIVMGDSNKVPLIIEIPDVYSIRFVREENKMIALDTAQNKVISVVDYSSDKHPKVWFEEESVIQSYRAFPNGVVEYHDKLFYWYTTSTPENYDKDVIDILYKHHYVDTLVDKMFWPDYKIDDKKEGVLYEFSNKDYRHYKKRHIN